MLLMRIVSIGMSVLTGGFLKGHRTQVLGAALVAQQAITPIAQYTVGDANLVDTVQAVSGALAANPMQTITGLAIITAGAKINRLITEMKRLE